MFNNTYVGLDTAPGFPCSATHEFAANPRARSAAIDSVCEMELDSNSCVTPGYLILTSATSTPPPNSPDRPSTSPAPRAHAPSTPPTPARPPSPPSPTRRTPHHPPDHPPPPAP